LKDPEEVIRAVLGVELDGEDEIRRCPFPR
jgi:hypothetical protein